MKPETFDVWFPRIWRLVVGIGGLAIVLWQGFHQWTSNPELYIVAAAMMGFAMANKTVELVGALGPQRIQELPPPTPTSDPADNSHVPAPRKADREAE